jgi:hypothetical protein
MTRILLKNLFSIFLFTLLLAFSGNLFAGGVMGINNSSSLSGTATVCQGTAPTITAVFSTCQTASGSADASNVDVTWYYNTTGVTGSLTDATVITGPTQLTTSSGNGTPSTFTLTSATPNYVTLVSTPGTYYIFCTITNPSNNSCGIGSSGALPLFSGTSSTPGVIAITVETGPIVDAGNDLISCGGAPVTLSGFYSGTATSAEWSAGSGTFSPNTTTLNASYDPPNTAGNYTLTLTTNDPPGICPAASDQVIVSVINTNMAVTSVTGSSPLCVGSTTTYTANGVNLAGGTGVWSSSDPSVALVNSSTGAVIGVGPGTANIIYTISGGCGTTVSAQQSITVTATATVTHVSGPTSQSACTTNAISNIVYELGGIATGATVTGLPAGVTAVVSGGQVTISGTSAALGTYNYTVTATGGGSCNQVLTGTITIVTLCNDDPCGAFPLTVGTTCTYTLGTSVGATATTGVYQPGCGSYSDNDVWYSAVVPANGVLTITANDDPGQAGTHYSSVAFYTGSCTNLMHQGCTDDLSMPAQYTGTPGETVYIRVWNYYDAEEEFRLCATTTAATMGNVLPGSTTVNCSGAAMTFTDPGGNGSYAVNQSAYYTICPSSPGSYVSVNFSGGLNFFNLGSGDALIVMNGPTSSSPIIYNLTGTTNPGTITSSDASGCLTFAFLSNSSTVSTGWQASVSCTTTAGTNNNNAFCSKENCSGGCGVWFCGTGDYPTDNAVSVGVDELFSNQNRGCFGGAGEVSSTWFYFQAQTDGTIEIQFDGPNGQDYDFAVYGPTTNYNIPCPINTGDGPIRCSFSGAANPIGIGNGATDFIEGAEGDGWVAPLQVQAGETYAMVLNIYQNGGPQPVIDIAVGGSALLDCTPIIVLPVSLMSFTAFNSGNYNELHWITASELNNDFFTVERSINGFEWEVVGVVDGAGNTSSAQYYRMNDENPYFPVTYYRLYQTDFDGNKSYSDIVSVNSNSFESDFISSIFPNPSSGYATFTYNGRDFENPINVEVINEMGQVVYAVAYLDIHKGMPATLRTSDLATGMYQVVFTQGETKQNQKLAIIR